MYEIVFYKDKNGCQPVLEYIKSLAMSSSKDSRIKFNKIQEYLQVLVEYGTQAGEPYTRHLDGEKKTQKTPPREIEQAKRELDDIKERGRQL